MKDAHKDRFLELLGLTKQDFEPAETTTEERLEIIEDAIIELAELITEDA